VIAVPNQQLKLKPGMTANVTIEVNRKSNVLRIPAAATRFRPTPDVFAALGQEVPPEARGGFGGRTAGGRGGGRGGQPGGAAPGGAPGTPAANGAAATAQAGAAGTRQARAGSAETRGGGDRSPQASAPAANAGGQNPAGAPAAAGSGAPGAGPGGGGRGFDPNMTPEERRKRMEERMAAMTPEERAAFQERMAARQAGQGGGFGGGQGAGAGRNAAAGQGAGGGRGGAAGQPAAQTAARQPGSPMRVGPQGRVANVPSITSGATTIDSLFGPLPTIESRGRAWLYINKQLKPVSLRLGISDGTNTEVLDGNELQVGTEVVTNVILPTASATAPAGATGGSQNPLLGPQRGGGGRGR
jgi:hypothetical protein